MTREEMQSNIEKLSELRAKYNCFDEEEESFYHALSLGIKGIKALEQEPCEDTISRAYIEPIIEELENICVNGDEHVLDLLADVKNAPPVTPQFCEDCVNRKAAIIQLSHNKIGDDDCDVIIQKDIETIKALPPATPHPAISQQKVGRCKDCKWWKDSDGTYRRGVGAESQCPINCREVYEGNGYCYMYKPQESEGKE